MGNWRTVHIDGTCDPAQVEALRKRLKWDIGRDTDWSKMPAECALSYSFSLCGLNDWPAARMNIVGNLFERDYSVESVHKALEELVQLAPSLSVKIHCGGEYEDKTCVATITAKDGKVETGPPEVRELPEINQDAMTGRLMQALSGSR